MPRSKLSSNLPVALRRQLDLTAAIARRRLLEVHFRHAMELIEHVDGELEPRRALDIYARLHKLAPQDAAAVNQEVYVALGRRLLPKLVEAGDASQDVRWEDPDSTLRQIRRRLRGRVNKELREWVEFHTGRTETAVFWAHVENAHEFVDLLARNRSVAEAVTLYSEEIALSPSWSEILYFFVLDDRSPAGARSTALVPAGARRGWPLAEGRPTGLRVVEKRRERGRGRVGG